jgi:hypothetical protein
MSDKNMSPKQMAEHGSKSMAGGKPCSDHPMGGTTKPMPMTTHPASGK